MSFISTQLASSQDTARRWAILTGVALLHVGAFYGLIVGLAGVVGFVEHDPPLSAHNDLLPIAPPSEQPKPRPHIDAARPAHRDSTDTSIVLRDPLPLSVTTPEVGPIDNGTLEQGPSGVEVSPSPTPTPTPAVTPRRAVPRGQPGGWITPEDYPAQDLREGNIGVTVFHLVIGRDGRPQACTIVTPSGHPRLDAATCALVSRRALFSPATDGTGATVLGSYQGRVTWTIPDR